MGIKSGIKRYIRGSVLNSRICLSWSDRLSVVRGEKMAFTDISGFLEVRSRCALVLAGGVCAYDLFFGGFWRARFCGTEQSPFLIHLLIYDQRFRFALFLIFHTRSATCEQLFVHCSIVNTSLTLFKDRKV